MFSTWSGLAFEKLCLNHEEQVRAALGVSGVSAEVFSWFSKAKEKVPKARGAQIDMLIDRADKTINVCEMKFLDEPSGGAERWSTPYSMSAKDEEDIERRVSALRRETGTDKQVIVTLITTKGLVRNRRTSERRAKPAA